MGNDSPKEPKNEMEKTLEIISQINFYLKNYKSEIIDFTKNNENLRNDIINFYLTYSKYEDIERFSIPVIGKISSGKSTILNNILNLKDALQVQSNTTTKFVCIIRHNKLLKGKEPIIYDVKFVKRTQEDNHYNFKKGNLIQGEVKKVIEKRNKDLIEKKIENIPQNYFYIIENYIPFFEGNYEKYADLFEFLDIPGLNEISDDLKSDNIYYENVLPLIVNNIKFSMFIFETKFYEAANSIQIYKKFNSKIMDQNKNYFDEKKMSNIPQINSIYILNKIDLCDKKGGLKQESKDFKDYLQNKLNVNIELNKIFLLNSKECILEKNKYDSFNNYLKSIIESEKKEEDVILNIKSNLESDFNIKITPPINNEEEDEQSEEMNLLNNTIKSFNYEGEINQIEYEYFKKIFEENKKKKVKKNNEINNLISLILKSIETTYNDFIKIEKYEKLAKEIKNQFFKDDSTIEELNIKTQKIDASKILTNKNYMSTITNLEIICRELIALEPEHEFIKNIYENFRNTKKYIEEDYKYRIALLGGISTGKSSIINSLIGYDLNLIPKSSSHCTKIILIIQYTQSQDNIALYKTQFDKHNDYSGFYYFLKEEKNLYAKGIENVKKKLNELNQNSKNEIPYFILQTPIEFLDNNIPDLKSKSQIEFVDLPGLNSDEEIDDNFLSNLINFTEYFLFINDKNVIQEENKELIEKFFLKILSEKSAFNLNSIMFIMNQIDDMPEIKNNKKNITDIVKDFSKEINDIYKKITSSEWNNYLKYSEIVQKDQDLLCTYFSNKYYNENIKKKKKYIALFNNPKELIKDFIEKYNLKVCKPEEMIENILVLLKKNYYKILNNKKDFNPNNFTNIDSDLNLICNELQIYKIKDGDIKKNIQKIKEITKYFIFIKNNLNKIDFKYNFNDFFSNIIERINKKNITTINSVILKFLEELNVSFKRIKENLKRYHLNLNIDFHESTEMTKKYEGYKKTIQETYKDYEKKLRNILNKIIDNKKDNEKYYKEFKDELNNFCSIINKNAKDCIQIILKCHRETIEKYSLSKIDKDEDIITISYKDTIFSKEFLIMNFGYIGISSLLVGGLSLFAEASLLNFGIAFGITLGTGLIFTMPLFLLVFYICFKIENKDQRKKKIEGQFKVYFKKISVYEERILNKMEEIYKIAFNDIRKYKISQIKPMKNIYDNKTKFESIIDKYKNIYIEIESKNS